MINNLSKTLEKNSTTAVLMIGSFFLVAFAISKGIYFQETFLLLIYSIGANFLTIFRKKSEDSVTIKNFFDKKYFLYLYIAFFCLWFLFWLILTFPLLFFKFKVYFFSNIGIVDYIYLGKPFYFTQEFWTALAVIVALFTPWVVNWLNKRQEKSNLVFEDISIVHQDSKPEEDNMRKLLDVGRLIITNKGKFKAKTVEAYMDKIISNNEVRTDFFPMPLVWTHGQLNKNGPTVRDIYPNQTVYLDIFNHIFDPEYVGDSSVLFAVADDHGVDSLSKMELGESDIIIKFYQESGQVNQIIIKAIWDGKHVPKISIIK
ncbi:MAG: hypothetical protein US50_C0034G0003 [Candidatus Nomurabacteria bacterium GW2011_GWB1_37_5]|uniref:Uncharacterized protein n=1 Tax=Candidatus Nomurabacteria bacterium GW2011_GWB1_37_5 TaxID=1618742 RepID=A0A0G0GXU4_9BACT|nr:MAG: hypothetical protein US50_C0034G0003 [Candidatus Nomurabacteria bacterium GW2011_GWB1_37_5]